MNCKYVYFYYLTYYVVAALQLLCWTQDCTLFYCQLSIAETHLETELQPAAAKTTGSHIGKEDTVPW